jgi:hypothetical protein
VNLVLSSVVLKLVPFRPRWVVYQTTTDGKVVYADTFFMRNTAERAKRAADDRVRFFSTRLKAEMARLPLDKR